MLPAPQNAGPPSAERLQVLSIHVPQATDSLLAQVFYNSSGFQALFRVGPAETYITEAVNRTLTHKFHESTGLRVQDFIGRGFEDLLEATGLSPSEIQSRRAAYSKAVREGRLVRFETPQSEKRDAVEILISPIHDSSGTCTHLLWSAQPTSDRLRAEQLLRESEERYSLVLQATQDGIYDWNLITGQSFLSTRYKEILGFDAAELPDDPTSFLDRVHPDDARKVKETVARIESDRSMNRFSEELRLRTKDGSYRWVTSHGRVVRDETGVALRLVGSISDVTETRHAAARVAASEKRVREILDSLFGFVGLFHLNGNLIDANRVARESLKATPGTVAHLRLCENFWRPPDSTGCEYVRDLFRRAASGQLARGEAVVRLETGRDITMDLTFGPLRGETGLITSVIGFGVDVTRRTEAESELRLAKQIAESSSRAKSEFLANMSHELRTPMNGIIGLTDVVLDSDITPEQREYLSIVRSSADSLLNILSDILDISKIQAGQFLINLREFWIRDLINSTMQPFAANAEAKSLRLEWRIAPDMPDVAVGDPSCIRQILANLVSNAVRFTTAGEVLVTVWYAAAESALHITVRDTGPGIPADKQAMIFEPFSQLDGSARREFGGSGLGLAISSQLAELMNGAIGVQSDGKSGSTFHFTARIAAVESPKLAGPTIRPSEVKDGTERRASRRVATDVPAQLRTSRPAAAFDVRILDISETGMRIFSEKPLEPGTAVEIRRGSEIMAVAARYCVDIGTGYYIGLQLDR